MNTIGLTVRACKEERGRNFREVNWEEFEEELERQLEGIAKERIGSKEEVAERLDKVMEALRKMVVAKVLEKRESTYAKRWWTSELMRMRRRVKAVGRESKRVIHIQGH